MKLYITLGLITVSFSTVFALRCYQCKYNSSVKCRENQTKCPLQCGSITIYNNAGTSDRGKKNCTDPALCVTDGIHFGQNKTTFNPQCCNTDLCNTEEPPASLRHSTGMCYTCDLFNKDCSNVVTCSGDQYKCFSTKVNIIGLTTKGCASDILCGDSLLNTLGSIAGSPTTCCEGILCNSGQSFKQSLPPFPLRCVLFLVLWTFCALY